MYSLFGSSRANLFIGKVPGVPLRFTPGFMPSCAPRTLLLRIAKIARLTPSIVGSDEF